MAKARRFSRGDATRSHFLKSSHAIAEKVSQFCSSDRTFSNHLMRSLKKFLSFAQAIALFRIISCDAYGGKLRYIFNFCKNGALRQRLTHPTKLNSREISH
ncbi:hypothetical protein [Nostoc sp.]|uniref:hypothetical protein n=1 Tax=Nostoc sp. TaxID=1180 RepID=UPI002FF592C6